jgi:hypothetical protein
MSAEPYLPYQLNRADTGQLFGIIMQKYTDDQLINLIPDLLIITVTDQLSSEDTGQLFDIIIQKYTDHLFIRIPDLLVIPVT